jgi:hypothetical protein
MLASYDTGVSPMQDIQTRKSQGATHHQVCLHPFLAKFYVEFVSLIYFIMFLDRDEHYSSHSSREKDRHRNC